MRTATDKKLYDREWYAANRMYKRTYERFQRRVHNSKLPPDAQIAAQIASDEIVLDRHRQIKAGLWIDERTHKTYTGVRCDG